MIKLPILILHGWNVPVARYKPLANEFKKQGYMVFIPDLPGFSSNSDMKKPLTLQNYAVFVKQYMIKNGINKPIVIGHSFGGRIAILLISQDKNVFSKMILTGVPGYPPVVSFKVKAYKLIANIGNAIFSLPILNYFANSFRKLLYFSAGSFDYYKTSGVLRETFKNIISFDLRPLLAKINTSTLIIAGLEDKITPLWIAEKMHADIKNSKLITLAGEGHSVIYNNPTLFIKYVL